MYNETPAWVGVTYLVYIVSMVLILWGGVGYAVFVLGHSGLWFVLSFLMSCFLITPDRWRTVYVDAACPSFATKPTTGK